MKNEYRTITGRTLDLSGLTGAERKLLREALECVRKAGGWNRFAAWWLKAFNESGLGDHSPVFRVCRDLEARLGIAEGKVARPDYRDYLADLIEERFGSRYRFCEATGIDPGQLSRVFTGKADLSAELLRRALGALGAHIEVRPNREASAILNRDEAVASLAEALR
ncbi:MAG TPA: helix-turn-helix transcriptional regulator [Gemmatimonadales bacterium]